MSALCRVGSMPLSPPMQSKITVLSFFQKVEGWLHHVGENFPRLETATRSSRYKTEQDPCCALPRMASVTTPSSLPCVPS